VARWLAAWLESSERTLRLKRALVDLGPVSAGVGFLDRRRLRNLEGDLHERSKRRWRSAAPTADLTWGTEVSGTPILAKATEYGAFGPGRTILEVGPGYGRLLRAALEQGTDFDRYVALDISAANVAHLRGHFPDARVDIVRGDAESASLPVPADALLSFLTFKHLYPSFERVLSHLVPQLGPDALVIFDLIEGTRRYFHSDEVTYIREYSREEVREILARTSLELLAFDEIVHTPGRVRLLVIARSLPAPNADSASGYRRGS
jgi:SAM-dependent methyltransferase